jgi:hypothetical protein
MTKLLGVVEGLCAIDSEICPRMLIGLGWDWQSLIKILQNLDGVVRGACVTYTNGVGYFEG